MTPSARNQPDSAVDMVEAARRLVPLIIASRDEGEQIRRVPSRLAEALAEAGLLQMFLPRSMGGPELDPLTVFHAIEEISKADGSIGWATMIATDVSLALGWLPADIGCQLSGYRELAGFQTDPHVGLFHAPALVGSRPCSPSISCLG
jgi:hypothetical protein